MKSVIETHDLCKSYHGHPVVDHLNLTVPEGCVYLLGDYRTNTTDSRDFGPVEEKQIKAKVVSIFRRRGI